MKTIIAGSREGVTYQNVLQAIDEAPWEITEVVCGMCRGADLLGKRWADNNHIPVDPYPAKWKVDGVFDRGAGHKRNALMAKNATALIALWDGLSPGTEGMIDLAIKGGLEVHIFGI
jgi:hypothetical protein